MRVLNRQLSCLLAALLLVTLAAPCYAISQPVTKPVNSMEAFLAEYGRGSNSTDWREYFARDPLLCTGDVALTGGVGRVDLVALAGVRVTSGAEVYWDDPELNIIGPPPCITVESGGTLRIQHWNPMMTNGIMPSAGMIRVEAGGVLQVAEGVTLPEGMVIVEEETPPNIVLPPSYEPEQIPIEALHESTLQVESVTGKSPVEAVLPNTVQVRLSRETGYLAALAVQWDLSSVPFDTPGTYAVYGDFIPDGLIYKGISNPKGLRPVVSLTILASTPVWDLVWGIAEPVSGGLGLVRLAFSSLPEDVEHLYLQRSTDGVRWSRCAGQNQPPDADLLPNVRKGSGMSFLTTRQRMEPTGFYLRLEVVGSSREGTSNILHVPAVADGDDGSSDGNRGGIQGTFDREGQTKPEEPSAVPEAAKGPEPLEEELPAQVESHETEVVQTELITELSGSTVLGGWLGSYGTLSGQTKQAVEQSPRHQGTDLDAEAVPEAPQQFTQVAAVPKETEAAQLTPDTDLPTLAGKINSSAPQDDGDTAGFVAVATLTVCSFSAAGLYLLHKRSIKRKS